MGKPEAPSQSTQRSGKSPPHRRPSRPRPPEPTPVFLAVCGLAAFGIIGAGVAWVVRTKATTELPATPVNAPPKPPADPSVDLLVQSVAPQAKLLLRGQSLVLPYHSDVVASKTPEMLEISAPGFQGRRFWIKLDRARAFTVALPQGSGSEDATYAETLVASGASRTMDPEGDL